ncbi:MAG: hypothetical protein QG552_654 [Thermodesulfobacteriota bacterium]|nr:hypothetical protein [Thermodesulfobacteriota bacterium]
MKSIRSAIGRLLACTVSPVHQKNEGANVQTRRIIVGTFAVIVAVLGFGIAGAQEITDCFYLKSLHYTARGMSYWYETKQGGLETLTKVPYDKLGCKGCHNGGCDVCHKAETEQKDCKIAAYTKEAATKQAMCLKCHAREKSMIGIDHKAQQEDVHTAQGMVCTDCHSTREMHGDGTPYVSMKQPGAMQTQCENCHDDLKPTEAHTVHKDRLDCKACHVRHVVSCTNCHFDHMAKTGERKARPVSGWVFLMNYEGKVSSATMQTFLVGENKTFLMFAPHMSHSIMKKGRDCETCHATEIVDQVRKGALKLTWLTDGKLSSLKGVIPVVDGVDYGCAYDDFVDGKWVPIENPPKPPVQYVGYGTPLSQEQLANMAKKHEPQPVEIPQPKK